MPTEKSIAAFDKLVGKERLDEYRKLLRLEWSPLTIRTLRRYIQHPTDVNFQAANDLLDDRRLHHPESPYQKQTRQRFDPLLADQPYDFSPYLSALRSGATRRRSTEGERRIELIVQFGAIVSYPIRLEVLGLAAGDPPPRHNQFLEFISSGLGLLPEIYYGRSSFSILALPLHSRRSDDTDAFYLDRDSTRTNSRISRSRFQNSWTV